MLSFDLLLKKNVIALMAKSPKEAKRICFESGKKVKFTASASMSVTLPIKYIQS